MTDWIDIRKDDRHVARERKKARELRNSEWWRNRIAPGLCHYCNAQVSPEDLTMDHLVPVARGGRSNRGNVVPCCKECNNRKRFLTPAEMVLAQIEEESRSQCGEGINLAESKDA
jgi:5-methylcytosine-specific restriction endonuclease McrA